MGTSKSSARSGGRSSSQASSNVELPHEEPGPGIQFVAGLIGLLFGFGVSLFLSMLLSSIPGHFFHFTLFSPIFAAVCVIAFLAEGFRRLWFPLPFLIGGSLGVLITLGLYISSFSSIS